MQAQSILEGRGSVGAVGVANGGTLAPGNTLAAPNSGNANGTLTINGNLVLAPGATFSPAWGYGSLSGWGFSNAAVAGTAGVAGNLLLNFTNDSGIFLRPGQYTIINAAGSLNGTFSSTTVMGLTGTGNHLGNISYDAHDVYVDLVRDTFVWSASPVSGDFNNNANWQNGAVPEFTDTAYFGTTSRAQVTFTPFGSYFQTLQLNPGTPAYSFTIADPTSAPVPANYIFPMPCTGTCLVSAPIEVVQISAGIVNNSSYSPTFIVGGVFEPSILEFISSGNAADAIITAGAYGTVIFRGNADAGAAAKLTALKGGTFDFSSTRGSNGDNNVSAGSIAGAGTFIIGADNFAVGSLGTSTEVSGVISGTGGSLTKLGGGTLILSGDNSYTGSTVISAGMLQIGNGDASGSVVGSIVDNSSLSFNRSDRFTVANAISGTGSLTQVSTGTLTLSGTNTYGGGTVVNAGTLNVSADRNLGAANGALILGGGTLQFGANFNLSSSRSITLGAAGGTIDTQSNTTNISQGIAGDGGLVKAGAGILMLTGTNTYTGGTIISAGTLQIGNGGTNGSITGNVTDNGTLIIALSNSYTLTGAFSGNGALIDNDPGVLTFSGPYSFTGTTTINGGGSIDIAQLPIAAAVNIANGTINLAGTSSTIGSLTGTGGTVNIAPGNTLTILSGNFGGSIAGGGALTMAGTGTLVLAGNDTLANTNVSSGTLEVNGTLTSPVSVGSGATLGGSGTIIGQVLVAGGGTYAPGDPVTSNVIGAVTFQKGSTYLPQETTAASDMIAVTGPLTIQPGATVEAEPLGSANSYPRVTSYPIITATQGVTGTFSSVGSTVAALSPFVSYSANSVTLTLVRNDISLATLASTPNQAGVAAALNAPGPASALYGAIAPNSDAAVKQSFDPLSGEIYASLRAGLIADDHLIRQSVLDHLDAAGDGESAWGGTFTSWESIDGNGNAATAGHNDTGLIIGLDLPLDGGFRAGIAGAFTGQKLSIPDRASTAAGLSDHVIAYANWVRDAFSLKVGADYGLGSNSVRRSIALPAQNDASHQGDHTLQMFGEAGYGVQTDGVLVEPYADLAYIAATTGAFAETGGIAALTGSATTDALGYSTLGAHFLLDAIPVSDLEFMPKISFGWQHALNAFTPGQTVAFISTGETFRVLSVPLSTDAVVGQVGLDVAMFGQGKLSFGYDGLISDHEKSHAMRASFVWTL